MERVPLSTRTSVSTLASMELRISVEAQFGARYIDLLKLAILAEEAGYDAFFRSDHYLKPGNEPAATSPTDAWITLAGLARETTTIRLGTLVTAATLRHPSVLAISVAQVHQMSGERIDFGLGSGHDAAEHRAYGIPMPEVGERFDMYTEQLEIITGLWGTPSGERFTFAGKHYELVDAPALHTTEKPPPMPPIIVGGGGKRRTPELAARFADEFNVIFMDSAKATAQFMRVNSAASAAGREPRDIVRSAAFASAVGRHGPQVASRLQILKRELPWLFDPLQEPDYLLAGSPAQVVDKIGRYRQATGISRLYVDILDVADLAQVELIASEVRPQLD